MRALDKKFGSTFSTRCQKSNYSMETIEGSPKMCWVVTIAVLVAQEIGFGLAKIFDGFFGTSSS